VVVVAVVRRRGPLCVRIPPMSHPLTLLLHHPTLTHHRRQHFHQHRRIQHSPLNHNHSHTATMKSNTIIATTLLLSAQHTTHAFNAFAALKQSLPTASAASSYAGPPPSTVNTESWLDVLTYDTPPSFDVLAKTIEFATSKSYEERNEYLSEDYVFRGPIIGPITFQDVKDTQQGFNIQDAFPNLETRPFGFTIDPDNAYRCYWFERWEGTNTNGVKLGPLDLPATNNDVKLPTHIMSVNWTPEGKIKYSCLSSPLDRFEGTTKGAGAIFGLLVGAGLDSGNASVGDGMLRFQQRLFHVIGGFGRNWSLEEDIPKWWKSKARGADPNDM
jgi:hypothetical protein